MYKCSWCETPFENQELKVGDEYQCKKCGQKHIIIEGIINKDDSDYWEIYAESQE